MTTWNCPPKTVKWWQRVLLAFHKTHTTWEIHDGNAVELFYKRAWGKIFLTKEKHYIGKPLAASLCEMQEEINKLYNQIKDNEALTR